jgi:hypothetical protein
LCDQGGVEFSAKRAPNPTPLSSHQGWRTADGPRSKIIEQFVHIYNVRTWDRMIYFKNNVRFWPEQAFIDECK